LKVIKRDKVVYRLSPNAIPAEFADPGEILVFETVDALGGQIKNESTPLESIDWSRVNPATGPVYIRGAEPGDTLVVKVLDIELDDHGVVVVVPGFGVLGDLMSRPFVKVVRVGRDYVEWNGIRIPSKPMIGVIGVAPPSGEAPTGDLGAHGGNMDVAELTVGTTLYLPVFVEGALLALGDLHAVQADGELCVSAAETSGRVTVKVDLIKGAAPRYPVLDLGDRIAILAYGSDLDEAARNASLAAVEGLMKRYGMRFEEAYALASLIVDLEINQLVDPKKGVRAVIGKNYISVDSLLVKRQ